MATYGGPMGEEREPTPLDDVTEDEDFNRDAEDDDDNYEVEAEELDEEDAAGDEARAAIARAEKERLRQEQLRKKALIEKMKAEEQAKYAMGEAARSSSRLQFLLKQAEIFQHFAPEGKLAATAAQKKSKGRGRHAHDEDEEDAQLLRDEEDEGSAAGHRLQVQPSILTGTQLRDYQLQGLNWLIHLYDNNINGILADEMGLGKTLQTISLIAYLHEYRGITGPHLVIVPKSTLGNWMNEFRRFCPVIRVKKFHGNAEQREAQKAQEFQPGKFDVCVTSYEMVIKEKNHFRRYQWRYVIIDEAHRIKNENSILSKVVRLLNTNFRLLITGTPLQNNLHELWALLNFLLPEVFSSAEKFEEWFSVGAGREREAEVVQQLHKVLRPFLLRRVKSDVERGLPPKKETILKIGMSDMQRKWYAALLQKDIAAVDGGADRSRLLNVVMQLRKCCNHPYLFQGAEPGPPYITGDHLVDNSGKMVLLDKLLRRLKERGSRVLVFSQMTRMLDILEDYCRYRGHDYCRIDGNTAGDDREWAIDEFNREGSEKFIFLLSTRAGGLGINLATADIVVLFDSDWNPQMDLQAMDRAHRIGQKKEVQVFRFCIENSIEEKVIEKAYKKLRLDALVIQQGRLQEKDKASKVSKDDLLSMVRYGAEFVFSTEASNITDQDIEALIQKGERDTQQLNNKMQEFTDNAKAFTLDGGMSIYDYKEKESAEGDLQALKGLVAANWVDPGKRERKRVANYSEADYYRMAMKSNKIDRTAGPRLPKMPALQDFQFYDVRRLTELFEKDHAYEQFAQQLSARESAARQQGHSEEEIEALLAPAPDDPQPLSEEEIAEKDALLDSGFSHWTRRDFNAFVRSCEKHGRANLAAIAADIDGKSLEEVSAYARVFWSRYSELHEWEKTLRQIERGEQKIQRQQDIQSALAAKLERYKNPWQELKISYGAAKGKAYTEEEDRFILCSIHQLGYGQWDDLKAAIRRHWRFRFDWFFKSRTPQELARRAETLIRLIEKEGEEDAAAAGKKGGGAKAGGKRRAGQALAGGSGAATPSATEGGGGTPNGGGDAKRARE